MRTPAKPGLAVVRHAIGQHPVAFAPLVGAMAGLIATVPMTLFMRPAHRSLPRHEQYSLPPEQIVHKAARLVGASAHPERPGWDVKTYLGHFGYGAASGMAYAAGIPRAKSSQRTLAQGTAFGLAVWAISYLGWLPAAGILPPATRAPLRRNLLMIVAHLIWGATLACVVEALCRPDRGDKPPRLA